MSRVCPRKPLFLLCASMIAVSRILRNCPETIFLYKNINDSLSKGEPVCDGHLHVPRAQGGRCPAIWVGSISIFQQHYEKYTICFRFHSSLLKMGSCCCDHRSECISNNWFCLRCPTSTGRVVPNRNQVYEISSDISVYYHRSDLRSQEKRTTPYASRMIEKNRVC